MLRPQLRWAEEVRRPVGRLHSTQLLKPGLFQRAAGRSASSTRGPEAIAVPGLAAARTIASPHGTLIRRIHPAEQSTIPGHAPIKADAGLADIPV
jgi:hypothetical protein